MLDESMESLSLTHMSHNTLITQCGYNQSGINLADGLIN